MFRKIYSICIMVLILISSTSYSQGEMKKVEIPRTEPGHYKGWRVCNYSGESRLWAAICYYDGSRWKKKGWYCIHQGRCRYVLNSLVPNHKLYLYAESKHKRWTGRKPLCAHPRDKFTHYGSTCDGEFRLYNYIEYNPGKYTGWETKLLP